MTATKRDLTCGKAPNAKRKGTYLLFLVFRRPCSVTAGALGMLDIPPGEYCYVGSAMNGLDERLERHLSREKRIRWHIDHLTMSADEMYAFVSLPPVPECALSETAERCGCRPVFKGFGCSDCRCGTHLFLTDEASKQRLLRETGVTSFTKREV